MTGNSPSAIFDETIKNIVQVREHSYGAPGDTFRRIVAMQDQISHCEDPAVRHAINMICVKLVRLASCPGHLDSAVDIAGYARTITLLMDESPALKS